jgi:hypothetical protein
VGFKRRKGHEGGREGNEPATFWTLYAKACEDIKEQRHELVDERFTLNVPLDAAPLKIDKADYWSFPQLS